MQMRHVPQCIEHQGQPDQAKADSGCGQRFDERVIGDLLRQEEYDESSEPAHGRQQRGIPRGFGGDRRVRQRLLLPGGVGDQRERDVPRHVHEGAGLIGVVRRLDGVDAVGDREQHQADRRQNPGPTADLGRDRESWRGCRSG